MHFQRISHAAVMFMVSSSVHGCQEMHRVMEEIDPGHLSCDAAGLLSLHLQIHVRQAGGRHHQMHMFSGLRPSRLASWMTI